MRNLALTSVFITSIAVADPAQFDALVQQIESGQRYFSSAEDYRSTLQLLEQQLPVNDLSRQQEHTERLTAEKQLAEAHINTLQVAQRWQYALARYLS